MVIADVNGAPNAWIHAMGGVLLVARIVHPFGLKADAMRTRMRFIGASGTIAVQIAAIGVVLWQVVGA